MKGWPFAQPKKTGEKFPAAEMSPVELTVVGQKREGEVCLRDTQPMLPSDRQQWRKENGGEGRNLLLP